MNGISNAAGQAEQARRAERVERATHVKQAIRAVHVEQAINEESGQARATGLAQGWTVMSYMLSGLVAYGAIGWLIARVTHVQLLFPIGMMVGIAVSVGYVIYRFGRLGAVEQAAARRASAAEVTAPTPAGRGGKSAGRDSRSAGRGGKSGGRGTAAAGQGTSSAEQRAHHVNGSVKGMTGDR
jgi:ATP synthase protein I